jgi:peptidoglycan/LPS O-acetylase OafA/YrhL
MCNLRGMPVDGLRALRDVFVVGFEIYTFFFEHGIIEACVVRFFFLMSGFKSWM